MEASHLADAISAASVVGWDTTRLPCQALELLQATKRPDGVDLLSPKGRAVWLPVERLVRQIYAAHGLPIAVPGAFDEEEEADPQPGAGGPSVARSYTRMLMWVRGGRDTPE